jgi:hypothetical protein
MVRGLKRTKNGSSEHASRTTIYGSSKYAARNAALLGAAVLKHPCPNDAERRYSSSASPRSAKMFKDVIATPKRH